MPFDLRWIAAAAAEHQTKKRRKTFGTHGDFPNSTKNGVWGALFSPYPKAHTQHLELLRDEILRVGDGFGVRLVVLPKPEVKRVAPAVPVAHRRRSSSSRSSRRRKEGPVRQKGRQSIRVHADRDEKEKEGEVNVIAE